jgi:hypothetical protein
LEEREALIFLAKEEITFTVYTPFFSSSPYFTPTFVNSKGSFVWLTGERGDRFERLLIALTRRG